MVSHGASCSSVGKEFACNAGIHLQCRRPRFNSWVWKIPLEKEMQPTPVFLPGEFHGQRSLAGYSPWGHKESDVIEWLILSPSWKSVVQSLSHVQHFETLWTGAHQTSLSFTISQSLLKLMSNESVMPSNHLILCGPLFFLSSIFRSIRVFSNESTLCIRWPKY